MANILKENKQFWEEMYSDQDTRRLDELRFPPLSDTKIMLVDPPRELQNLQGKIDDLWEEFSKSKEKNGQKVFNGDLYSMPGWSGVEYSGNTLIVRAFRTNFATLLLKQDARGRMTPKEQNFLDSKIIVLGSSGYVRQGKNYLVGQVAKRNIKQDLWETVPMGFVDYGFHQYHDPFRKTMNKEAKEETNLNLEQDFDLVLPWGINIGSKIGNCTMIYQLQLKPESLERVKCSSEHLALRWATKSEILDPAQRYSWNPITPRLFEKVKE